MEKSFKFKAAYAVALLLIALVIVSNIAIVFISGVQTITKVGCIPSLLCCASALYYALKGFGKNAAESFTAYMFFLAFTILHNCFVSAYKLSGTAAFGTTFLAIAFACIFALFLAKDLGKKKSLWLISIALAVQLFILLVAVFMRSGNNQYTADLFRALGVWHLNLLGLVLVIQKYADKAARGTK